MKRGDTVNWLSRTKTQSLDTDGIDLDDASYLIPCFEDDEILKFSIASIGMVNFPVVQARLKRKPIVVLGRRRLEAAREIGMEQVTVRIIPSEMPETDGFVLAFWDNLAHRGFDLPTKAMIVKRLLELFPKPIVAYEFLPLLGIPPRGPRLERLRKLADLEHPAMQALADGRIQEKTAALLAEMDFRDRTVVLDVIERLGMNANKNAETVSHLFDLSVFQRRSVTELLAEELAARVLNDDELSKPEKAERFRDLVRSWKFPDLADREREFGQWRRDLALTAGINVQPAEGFEGDEYSVKISCRSRDRVKKMIDLIREGLGD